MQRLLNETVPEVGRIAAAEGIDCHFAQGGSLSVARNAAQLERIRSQVADYAAWGFGEEDHRLLDADGVREFAAVDGVARWGLDATLCRASTLPASCAGSPTRWSDGG